MLAMATSLVLMVSGFVWLTVSPSMNTSERLVRDYLRRLADRAPDQETAKRIAAHLDIQIRYEGPEGAWATAQDLPTIEQAAGAAIGQGLHLAPGRDTYVFPGPGGGSYLFSWEFRRRIQSAHTGLVWLLLAFVAAAVFTAHVFLRRLLRPLRRLHEAVTQLSEGRLDIVVPSRTRDEFGALTEAFNQMVRRVRDMLRARDQLLLDVSHELRSPLTRMKVALALLPEGEKRRGLAADVAEMESMITELLELERLREGRGIQLRRQDLVPVLREVAQSFEGRPPGVRVVAGTPQEVVLDLDGDKIRIVLRNLLENALKYSLPDSGPVEVAVSGNHESVVVQVRDDGPGIPEADLDSLFEPFFRVDRSRSRNTGGYGLGLSICRRILEAHGGGIAAANLAGRGASFTLTLPRAG
jgi:signal transduction histidine kinase